MLRKPENPSERVSITDLVPNHCAKCLQHFFANPMIVEALASVGIEHGKSSGQMAQEFYAEFHRNKHRAADEPKGGKDEEADEVMR